MCLLPLSSARATDASIRLAFACSAIDQSACRRHCSHPHSRTHTHTIHTDKQTRDHTQLYQAHMAVSRKAALVSADQRGRKSQNKLVTFKKTGKLASVFILSPFCSVIKVKNTFYWQLFLLFDQTKAYLFQSQINTKKYLSFFEEYLGFLNKNIF